MEILLGGLEMTMTLESIVDSMVASVIEEIVVDYLDSYLRASLIKLSEQEGCTEDFKQHIGEHIKFNRNGYQEWNKWDEDYSNLINLILEMATLRKVKLENGVNNT